MGTAPIMYPAAIRELHKALGDECACRVMERASAERVRMLHTVDDRGSSVVRAHAEAWMVPVAAAYVALREELCDQERALDLTFSMMCATPTPRARGLRILRWVPGRFTLFRMAHRRALARDFVPPGWDCEVTEDCTTRFSYVMRSCCYRDIYEELGVPEVAPLSCRMDDVEYALLPEIRFRRAQTLVSGGESCEFSHYVEP